MKSKGHLVVDDPTSEQFLLIFAKYRGLDLSGVYWLLRVVF